MRKKSLDRYCIKVLRQLLLFCVTVKNDFSADILHRHKKIIVFQDCTGIIQANTEHTFAFANNVVDIIYAAVSYEFPENDIREIQQLAKDYIDGKKFELRKMMEKYHGNELKS